MSNDKGGIYSSITVIVFVVIQLILKSIGVDNISIKAFVGLLVLACSLVIIGVFRDGKKGHGIKYNVTIAILLVIACICTSVTMIVFKGYPELLDKYGAPILILELLSFFSLTLFIIIYRFVYERKHR